MTEEEALEQVKLLAAFMSSPTGQIAQTMAIFDSLPKSIRNYLNFDSPVGADLSLMKQIEDVCKWESPTWYKRQNVARICRRSFVQSRKRRREAGLAELV